MQGKFEAAGAIYIFCDEYNIQMTLTPKDGEHISKDIAFSMSKAKRTCAEIFSDKHIFAGYSVRPVEQLVKNLKKDCFTFFRKW